MIPSSYMQIVLWIAVLIASLFFLIKSADYFTEYSEKIGLLFGMSSFIIGATIVAVGTSLPELVSSLFAISAGETTFVVDNIIGSNIANALLILGISGIVAKTLKINTSLIDVDLPFFFMSMALFGYFALDSTISFAEGIALLVFFVIFIVYNIRQKPEEQDADEMAELATKHESHGKRKRLIVRHGLVVLASIIVLSISAKYLIDSILTLSELLNITSSILTITVVAFGTSLPEILTSVAAVRRGNHGMAIGNVLGSNTFNLLLIAGIPALITPLSIDPGTFAVGMPFLVIATFIAIFVTFDNKVKPWEGAAMIMFYVVFIAKIIGVM